MRQSFSILEKKLTGKGIPMESIWIIESLSTMNITAQSTKMASFGRFNKEPQQCPLMVGREGNAIRHRTFTMTIAGGVFCLHLWDIVLCNRFLSAQHCYRHHCKVFVRWIFILCQRRNRFRAFRKEQFDSKCCIRSWRHKRTDARLFEGIIPRKLSLSYIKLQQWWHRKTLQRWFISEHFNPALRWIILTWPTLKSFWKALFTKFMKVIDSGGLSLRKFSKLIAEDS